jgi:moderate conductance mechanosensitive channel
VTDDGKTTMTRILTGLTDPLFEACGETPGLVCEWVLNLSNSGPAARFADWFVAKPLKILLILAIAWILTRLLRRGISRMIDSFIAEKETGELDDLVEVPARPGRLGALRARTLETAQQLAEQRERRRQRAQALGTVLNSIAALTVYGLAAVIAMAEFGISVGPLVAGAGIVGIALGFGAQTLVRDFLHGIFMLVEDQYGVGDVIDAGEAVGLVEEVTLRTTRLRDIQGRVWYIPNGEIRRVGNLSQKWGRAVLDLGVSYDTDLDHAMEVMKRVADELWHAELEGMTIIEEPEIIGVEAFGDSEITLRVMMKTAPIHQFKTMRELRKRMKEAFDREGIEIPFPQRTVWMHHETPHGSEQAAGGASPIADG